MKRIEIFYSFPLDRPVGGDLVSPKLQNDLYDVVNRVRDVVFEVTNILIWEMMLQ